MKTLLGSLFQKLQLASSAFAYEHSGEMLSTKGKYQALSGLPVNVAVNRNQQCSPARQTAKRRILMTIDRTIDPEVISYTFNAAKKFDASIDILSKVSYEELHKTLQNAGDITMVNWRHLKLEKDLASGIADYTSSHSGILFMITDQHSGLADTTEKSRPAA